MLPIFIPKGRRENKENGKSFDALSSNSMRKEKCSPSAVLLVLSTNQDGFGLHTCVRHFMSFAGS
jgi:hypothetical protein